MRTFSWFLLAVILGLSYSEFCFRRYKKKKGFCKGKVKKFVGSAIDCCKLGKSHGYATQLKATSKGRRGFDCSPCKEDNRIESGTDTKWKWYHHRYFGIWSEWAIWTSCSRTCLAGMKQRSRICQKGRSCVGSTRQVTPCMMNQHCPTDGQWSSWSAWTRCDKTCGGGRQSRARSCDSPMPRWGGKDCEGKRKQSRECKKNPCPVRGRWSDWEEITKCSVTCGSGIRTRRRQCNNPPPAHGGDPCYGASVRTNECRIKAHCPVNGMWSLWTGFSACTATCGDTYQTRRRQCDAPAPRFGGKHCSGDSMDKRNCTDMPVCPTDGNWSPWTGWGWCVLPFNASCGTGNMWRTRTCDAPPPSPGGRNCVGGNAMKIPCYKCKAVPPGCEMAPWSECWAKNCTKRRQRVCTTCPTPEVNSTVSNSSEPCSVKHGIDVEPCSPGECGFNVTLHDERKYTTVTPTMSKVGTTPDDGEDLTSSGSGSGSGDGLVEVDDETDDEDIWNERRKKASRARRTSAPKKWAHWKPPRG